MPFRLIAVSQGEAETGLSPDDEARLRAAVRFLKPSVIYSSPHPAAQAAARLVAQELGAEGVQIVPEMGLDPQEEVEMTRERRPTLGEVMGGILKRHPPEPRLKELVTRSGLALLDEKLTELWQRNRQLVVLVASAKLIQAYLAAHQRFQPQEMGAPFGPLEVVVATYPDPYLGSLATAELPGRESEVLLGPFGK